MKKQSHNRSKTTKSIPFEKANERRIELLLKKYGRTKGRPNKLSVAEETELKILQVQVSAHISKMRSNSLRPAQNRLRKLVKRLKLMTI